MRSLSAANGHARTVESIQRTVGLQLLLWIRCGRMVAGRRDKTRNSGTFITCILRQGGKPRCHSRRGE
jgi:hypothetical protein